MSDRGASPNRPTLVNGAKSIPRPTRLDMLAIMGFVKPPEGFPKRFTNRKRFFFPCLFEIRRFPVQIRNLEIGPLFLYSVACQEEPEIDLSHSVLASVAHE